jgi:hypothetical protein
MKKQLGTKKKKKKKKKKKEKKSAALAHANVCLVVVYNQSRGIRS